MSTTDNNNNHLLHQLFLHENSTQKNNLSESLTSVPQLGDEIPRETTPKYELDLFFDFIVPGVLLNAIGLLGLIGNVISIIILSRPQMRSSINCILIGLASYDSVLILTGILMFGLPSVHTYTSTIFSFYYYKIFPYITPFVYPIGLIAQTGSVYLTLCVTIERYVAVCLPLRARSLCTYGRARCYVIGIGIFAILYNLPRFWEVTWQTDYIPEYSTNYTQVVSTELRNNQTYISVYITWMYLVVMYIIPFICLAAFNLRIYFQVRKANSERARLSRLQKKEIGLATMLMCVVFVFFVCNLLALVVNLLEVMGINITALTQTSNMLITLNSSVNFIIYCIFGEKFKRIFYRLFCPLIMKEAGAPKIVHRFPPTGVDNASAAIAGTDNPGAIILNRYPTVILENDRSRSLSNGRGDGNSSNSWENSSSSTGHKGSMGAEINGIALNHRMKGGGSCTCLPGSREMIPLRRNCIIANGGRDEESLTDSLLIDGASGNKEDASTSSSTTNWLFPKKFRLHRSNSDYETASKRKKASFLLKSHILESLNKSCETTSFTDQDDRESSIDGNPEEILKEDVCRTTTTSTNTTTRESHITRLVVPGATQDITITVNIRTSTGVSSRSCSKEKSSSAPSSHYVTDDVDQLFYHHPSSTSSGSAHTLAAREAVKLLCNSSHSSSSSVNKSKDLSYDGFATDEMKFKKLMSKTDGRGSGNDVISVINSGDESTL